MKCDTKYNIVRFGRALLKLFFLSAAVFGMNAGIVSAAPISGSLGVGGSFSTSGADVTNDWLFTIDSVDGGTGSGVITVGLFSSGTVNNGDIDLDLFTPITDLFVIDGWQVDLETLVIGQTGSVWELGGTGFISGGVYDKTAAVWELTGNEVGSSYSMSITAVPVPAAMWLFGSGLIGLIGIARRKTA